ncbi:LacI family DNA-binding transcriptional regulator [Larkinella insperata]|uniref:LacI family DNA-binding transcriptional regulator n=1 Tax=Larkinella insperata TaxID=332158 RepID=A0ABW3QN79_9BACT|nr:substrate-binding domain-containing protein [Larkinella insperata]
MAKKTSLKDIAQEVGVSTALVSYVLNNKKENKISKQVAQKIRAVAKALNYRPNQIAKSLKTNKTFTLGLVVADISNPFSSSLTRIIEDEADQQQYTVLVGSSDEQPQKARKLIETLLNRQVDGLLIVPTEGMEKQLADLQKQGVPFVLIDRYFPDLKTNYVALDNYGAIYKATQHLIDSGYRRIGMITFQTTLYTITERKRGYLEALKANNITFSKSWLKEVRRATYKTDIEKAVRELLGGKNPVEAILFASNTLALFGLKPIKELQKRVPDDVAIITLDQADAYDLFHTPVTYIRQPLPEMGQLATRILLESIPKNNAITQTNLDGELVIRASTRST